MSLLPSYLIQALFAFGGVCLVLCITVFHYFKDKVDDHILEKMKELFSSSSTSEFIRRIKTGKLPKVVIRDFNDDLFEITSPRRRLQTLLLLFPIAGCLFILSASLAILASPENEFVSQILPMLEYIADLVLAVAVILIIYCTVPLVRLLRELL